MNEKNLQRKHRKKTMAISIRITPTQSKFMKDKNFSPTAILNEALKELGHKEETQ